MTNRKTMKGVLGASGAALALMAGYAFVGVEQAAADNFAPYMNTTLGGGNKEGLGSLDFYAPIPSSDETGAALIHLGTSYDSDNNWTGTLGFGYRWALAPETVLGANIGFDILDSEFSNTFIQGRIGGDAALGNFGVFTNFYFPLESGDSASEGDRESIENGFFVTNKGRENTLWGGDLKVEYNFEMGPEGALAPYAKVFMFDSYTSGGGDSFGYQLGAAFKIFDIDFLGLNGSKLIVDANFRDEFSGDNVRDEELFAGLTLSIPFAFGTERTERQSKTARNIVRPFENDRDVIVTNLEDNGDEEVVPLSVVFP